LSKRKEKLLIFFSDIVFINIAWIVYYYIRIETRWINYANPPAFLIPMVVIFFYWVIIFSFSGLYRYWFVRSRFDEFASVVKSVTLGCIVLFFAIYIDDALKDAKAISRLLIVIYWVLMTIFVSSGRITIRGFQMRLLQKGIGLRNSIIVGSGSKAQELYEMINKYPQLGYKFFGYIGLKNNGILDNELGKLENIKKIIDKFEISEVLVALEPKDKVVSGMARTEQIYGVPLIEVMPELMPFSSRVIKRLIDIFISSSILVILFPILLLTAFLIKVSSKGPIFYIQKRVGRGGKIFNIYKFRSMVENAEQNIPVWADKDDPRVTSIGKVMRKLRIDEVPQFFNVLINDMSIVGPRPERPYFVEELKKEIPYYTKRQAVKPGITGWAQVKHTYDSSIEDVKTKLQYDFYYIENMSLSLDFKIMLNTLFVVFLMRGH
jgi:lipopolysaccharide/colanic/teichoic acid biosynthesis glycosyltransferase